MHRAFACSALLAAGFVLTLSGVPAARAEAPGTVHVIEAPSAPDGLPQANESRMRATLASARPANPSGAALYSQTYIWPLDRHLHDGLLIVNYVDHDTTTSILDYSGGQWSYDGHTGTDNVLYDFRLMDRGVQVRAAAAGTVAYLSNSSPYDRHCDFNWPDAGNWVWIAAPDGSYHEYLHLRTASMTVKLGDSVQPGELLGLVGSSGYSTQPHLHFEAGAYDGPGGTYRPRDPYHGPDNALPGLWNVQPDYEGTTPFWVADLGVFTEAEEGGSVFNTSYCDVVERIPQPLVYGQGENKLCMWFQFQSRCCDTATVVVRKPDGSVYGSFDFAPSAPARFDWFWSWFYLAPYTTAADEGTWRQQVYAKNGPLLADHPFVVGTTTTFGPRFWPRAGRSFTLDGTVQRDTLREYPLGPAVTYSLLNAPAWVSLQDSIVSVGPASTQPSRSSFFQVVMDAGAAGRDTAFYHVVDMSKPLDPLLAVPPAGTEAGLSLAATPQPSHGVVTLRFALPARGPATLAIYDLAGRRLRALRTGPAPAGAGAARWDGRDDAGRELPAGLYFARLATAGGSVSRAIVRD